MKGFRKFLMRGNLIDLAVAVVIGVAFNNIVTALINDFIGPLIGAVTGGSTKPSSAVASSAAKPGSTSGASSTLFQDHFFTLHNSQFLWGDFVDAVISFLVIAAVVYFLLVAPTQKLTALAARNQAATDRECPECLSQIPLAARRCKYCTAVVPPAPAPDAAEGPVFPALRMGRHRHAPGDPAGPAPELP